MDNSILVSKYIRRFLVENEEVQGLIDVNKIFPLIANADTTFPFIVFQRSNLMPIYTKDILTENQITMVIIVVSNDYIQSLDLANAVRHALEGNIYRDNDILISAMKMESITEETLEDAYIQRMVFTFNVQ